MQCPNLSVDNGKKTCKRMAEAGMDGEVSDFDVQHYCNGNPNNCYYFRTSDKKATVSSERTLKHKLSQISQHPNIISELIRVFHFGAQV
jgi:hypothetical protein